ncbi:ATP-binding protein [Streptomyces sp. RB6PN25]|uniref:histidine kinase n=1 Tax=Streptomyces humicola TaxID=2953240 RepID=A0ABT1Q2B4_9ACTN|nr:ATP-binding protein [Streptomyces humicola]MCQ4082895.1 ATP-binding protein [Streptomyces humicola]
MVRAEGSPGSQRLASVLLLLPPVTVAALTVLAEFVVSAGARWPVAWCGGAATLAVAVVAAEGARRGRVIAELREQNTRLQTDVERRIADQQVAIDRLADAELSAAVGALQQGASIDEVMHGVADDSRLESRYDAARRRVLRYTLNAVSTEEDLRETSKRGFESVSRRVQAIVNRQSRDIEVMQDRHGRDADVLRDLMHLDHGTQMIGRLADSIAVLSGARSGRQWVKPQPLYNVLRAAVGRILHYTRVDIASVPKVAVDGPAVEPLIHAMAEMLDNATQYSPPKTRVILSATEVQAGVAMEIEDRGLGLSEETRARAEHVLEQARRGIDLNELGETPQLGLAVVGRLAQTHGFQVELRPNAYGGVRAVLTVPRRWITTAPVSGVRARSRALASPPRPVDPPARRMPGPRQPFADAEQDDMPVAYERTANGLPQRHRRMAVPPAGSDAAAATVISQMRADTPPDAPPPPASSTTSGTSASSGTPVTEEPGMWVADFMRGLSGAPATSGPEGQAGQAGDGHDGEAEQ